MLGAAAILVSVMTQTDQYQEARHMDALPSVFFSAAGALAALIITPFAVYHARDNADRAANLLVWIGLGIAFGIAWSFVVGALTPLTLTLISYAENSVTETAFVSQLIDAMFNGIRSFFIQGAYGIYTGFLVGSFFCFGGFAIDKLNSQETPQLSSIGPWAVSIVLGTAVLAFSVLGPPELLRHLG